MPSIIKKDWEIEVEDEVYNLSFEVGYFYNGVAIFDSLSILNNETGDYEEASREQWAVLIPELINQDGDLILEKIREYEIDAGEKPFFYELSCSLEEAPKPKSVLKTEAA